MHLIERKPLVRLLGAYLALTSAIAVLVHSQGVGPEIDSSIPDWVAFLVVLPSVLIVPLSVSALLRMFRNKQWAWVLVTVVTAFVGVILYGLQLDGTAEEEGLAT